MKNKLLKKLAYSFFALMLLLPLSYAIAYSSSLNDKDDHLQAKPSLQTQLSNPAAFFKMLKKKGENPSFFDGDVEWGIREVEWTPTMLSDLRFLSFVKKYPNFIPNEAKMVAIKDLLKDWSIKGSIHTRPHLIFEGPSGEKELNENVVVKMYFTKGIFD